MKNPVGSSHGQEQAPDVGAVLEVISSGPTVVHREVVTAELVASEAKRVHGTKGPVSCPPFILAHREGQEEGFAQAMLLVGRRFRLEVDDSSTPRGYCKVAEPVTTRIVIRGIWTWIVSGEADPGIEWSVERWSRE